MLNPAAAAPHVVVTPGIGPSRAGQRSALCILSTGPGPAADTRRSPLPAPSASQSPRSRNTSAARTSPASAASEITAL